MSGNRLLLCLAVLTCAAGVGAPSAWGADACATIQPGHRVFVSRRGVFGQVLNPNGAYAACLYSVGRVVLLEPQDGFSDLHIDSLRSAGPYFAYVYGKDDFNTDFVIGSVDLRTGRYVHMSEFFDRYGDAGVTDLILKTNGSIAWVVVDSADRRTLRVADKRGSRVPRHGHGVARFSLRLRGSRIFWRQGHTTRSTRLY